VGILLPDDDEVHRTSEAVGNYVANRVGYSKEFVALKRFLLIFGDLIFTPEWIVAYRAWRPRRQVRTPFLRFRATLLQ
jgi:hypothetical protein